MATQKATAKRSQSSKTTTSKGAGVRSRKPAKVRASVVRANARNASARVRQFATDDGLVDYLDSLPALKMPAKLVADQSVGGAVRRREWCVTNGIPAVRAYDDGFMTRRAKVRPATTNDWRPDNAVRVRLERIGNLGHGFGYTRAETAGVQTRMARALDWSKGEPDTYEGADEVYIYRV